MRACSEGLEPLFPCGSTSLRCALRLWFLCMVSCALPRPLPLHLYLMATTTFHSGWWPDHIDRAKMMFHHDLLPQRGPAWSHRADWGSGIFPMEMWDAQSSGIVSWFGIIMMHSVATRQWPLAYPWSRYLTDLCRQWEIGNLLECCHSAMGWAMDLWEVENELLSLDQYQQSILHWPLHIMQLILCSAMVYQKNKTKQKHKHKCKYS